MDESKKVERAINQINAFADAHPQHIRFLLNDFKAMSVMASFISFVYGVFPEDIVLKGESDGVKEHSVNEPHGFVVQRSKVANMRVSTDLVESVFQMPSTHKIVGAYWNSKNTVVFRVKSDDFPLIDKGCIQEVTPVISENTNKRPDEGWITYDWGEVKPR